MTKIEIVKKDGNIVAFKCTGHTGYATNGKDIVCASVSTIVQTAVLGLQNIALAKGKLIIDEKSGLLSYTLPTIVDVQKMRDCQVILGTMQAGLEDLQSGYGKFLKVEVIEDVY